VPLSLADFEHPKLSPDQTLQILDHVSRELDVMRHWERDALFELCQSLASWMGLKIREFLFPLFIALSGRPVALPLFDSMVLLGAGRHAGADPRRIGCAGCLRQAGETIGKALSRVPGGAGDTSPQGTGGANSEVS
jgi:hypothetical protein